MSMLYLLAALTAGEATAADAPALEAVGTAAELGLTRFRAELFSAQNYVDPDIDDLDNPNHDVEVIAGVLRKQYGFEANVHLDATRGDIIGTLDRLKSDTAEDEAVLIYFAGHGVAPSDEEDRGYWLPVDADDVSSAQWVSNDDVASKIGAMPARHVLVVSDSCFSGKFRATTIGDMEKHPKDVDYNYAIKLSKSRSRFVLTSGGNEPVVDGGADGMSMFAYAFKTVLEQSSERYLTPYAFFPELAKTVSANADQAPLLQPMQGARNEYGQIVLLNQSACGATLQTMREALEGEAEADWERTVAPVLRREDSGTAEALAAFVRRWDEPRLVEACSEEEWVRVSRVVEAQRFADLLAKGEPIVTPAQRRARRRWHVLALTGLDLAFGSEVAPLQSDFREPAVKVSSPLELGLEYVARTGTVRPWARAWVRVGALWNGTYVYERPSDEEVARTFSHQGAGGAVGVRVRDLYVGASSGVQYPRRLPNRVVGGWVSPNQLWRVELRLGLDLATPELEGGPLVVEPAGGIQLGISG